MLRPRISPTSATRISAVRRGLRHLQRCPPLGVADAGLRSVNAPPSQQLLQQQHERDPQHAADLPILEQHLQEQLQQLGAHQVQTAHQAPLHLTQQQLSQQQHQAPVQHTLNGTTISSSISNAIAAPEIAAAAATQPTSTITNTSTTSTNSTSTTTSASTSTSTSTSSNQAEAHAKRLFDFNPSHIPAWSPLLALYFPIGVVVAALRMLLWIGGVLIDAPWFRSQAVVRTYLSLLGFKATWRNTELLPKGRHVMVSNHITPGDLMVLFEGLPQRYTHLITTAMPPRVVTTKHLPCTLRFATPEVIEQLAGSNRSSSSSSSSSSYASSSNASSSSSSGAKQARNGSANGSGSTSTSESSSEGNQQHLHQQRRQHQQGASTSRMSPEDEQQPVHLFPEGGVTHGRWGMMQFTRGFTRMVNEGDWVAPVALRVQTPWNIRTHTLLSSFPANLFWMSFCPWIRMEATVLPPMQLQPGEAKGVFAKRVQQAIAEELGQVVSECNITVKKRVMQQQQAKLRKQHK